MGSTIIFRICNKPQECSIIKIMVQNSLASLTQQTSSSQFQEIKSQATTHDIMRYHKIQLV
jgi:hypothetical protein